MMEWDAFTVAAPRISALFARRHVATGGLCMLATIRPDGIPRICPIEPRIAGGELWLSGIPGTAKFADLDRDQRFALHTATTSSNVADGDAKLWGHATAIHDPAKLAQHARVLFEQTGIDTRAEPPHHIYAARLSGAAAVDHHGDQLHVTTWTTHTTEHIARTL